ncbi:MAG TPA: hypothetical protein VFQ88_04950 [Nevskiaceae bacterium]|nr:hypothetical protein [Nevskiaceae bacterium]
MDENSDSAGASFLRRNLGPLLFVAAVVITAILITMAATGYMPRWFLMLATVI